MQLTSSILLFAIGASAAATPHRGHQRFHEKRAVGDEVTAVIDGQIVHWTNTYDGGAVAAAQSSGATPATTEAATVATDDTSSDVSSVASTSSSSTAPSASSSASASAGNSQSSSSYTPFCSASTRKRATLSEIAYKGNTGSGSYGCNLQLVDASIADQYDYTLKFSGESTSEQQCVCWNKIGEDGGINGWFGAAPLSFSLPAGSEQYVAVDSNSQGGCGCYSGATPKDANGAWAMTWVEFDMCNSSNDAYSGADISALVAQTSGMTVQGMSVCTEDGSQCSSLGPNATNNKLAYVKGMEADDGVGINLAPGKVRLNVVAGYSG